MTTSLETTTGILLIAGALFSLAGFALFSSQIYTSADIPLRQGLLAASPRRWRFSQSVVLLGAPLNIAGFILLARLFQDTDGFAPAALALAPLLPGHLLWAWHVWLRISRPSDFGGISLPAWHFNAYAFLTPFGLACLGIAFWLQGSSPPLGAVLVLFSAALLAIFLKFKDIPPFTYLLLSLSIGLVILI